MARTKKFKGPEGETLEVTPGTSPGTYMICWIFPRDEFSEGASIGEDVSGPEPDPASDQWISWKAYHVAKKFGMVHYRPKWEPLLFENEKKAKEALRAINEALTTPGSVWPDWAKKAKAAGWTPPEGWTP